MTEDKQNKFDPPIPIGDTSHLVEELPPPRDVVTNVPLPVNARLVDDNREILQTVVAGTMRGQVVHTASGEEQAQGLKLIKEPCPKCESFYYPLPDSQEYREIASTIKRMLATIPEWMRTTLQGRDPDEWGICRENNAMCHPFNTFECFKPRKGTIALHRAKDRRDP